MWYSNDPVKDFERYDAEQTRKLEKRPLCDYCEEHIQDDFYFEINGDCICQDCLELHFRKAVPEDE